MPLEDRTKLPPDEEEAFRQFFEEVWERSFQHMLHSIRIRTVADPKRSVRFMLEAAWRASNRYREGEK